MIPSSVCLRATSRSSLLPKRLQFGLYDGRSIQSGNQVGETYSNKTRRNWLPNKQTKTVWSEALESRLKLRLTTGTLRSMDKAGGLDSYLFRMKPERLGKKGMELRRMVQDAHVAGKIARELAERSAVPIPLGRRITPEATPSIPAPL